MPSFTMMGVAAALVIVCMVAAAITLLPALLRLMGRRVFGRRARRAARLPRTSFRSARAERLARMVIRRPVHALALGALLLIALAAPAASMRLGQNDAGSEQTANPTRQAYDLVADAFGPGTNGPLQVVINRSAMTADAFAALPRRLAGTPGVADVSAPVHSPDGQIAVLQVTPTTGPQQPQTRDLVARLHDGVLPPGACITGPTAAMLDITTTLSGHLWQVLLAVLAATFTLMLLVFRSIVLPAKAVLTNLLSVAASYGVMTLAFQTTAGAALLGLPARSRSPPGRPSCSSPSCSACPWTTRSSCSAASRNTTSAAVTREARSPMGWQRPRGSSPRQQRSWSPSRPGSLSTPASW
jgi:RND superfamily putative drug exporter